MCARGYTGDWSESLTVGRTRTDGRRHWQHRNQIRSHSAVRGKIILGEKWNGRASSPSPPDPSPPALLAAAPLFLVSTDCLRRSAVSRRKGRCPDLRSGCIREYRAEKKGWYVVARYCFLALLSFSAWPGLAVAEQDLQTLFLSPVRSSVLLRSATALASSMGQPP